MNSLLCSAHFLLNLSTFTTCVSLVHLSLASSEIPECSLSFSKIVLKAKEQIREQRVTRIRVGMNEVLKIIPLINHLFLPSFFIPPYPVKHAFYQSFMFKDVYIVLQIKLHFNIGHGYWAPYGNERTIFFKKKRELRSL